MTIPARTVSARTEPKVEKADRIALIEAGIRLLGIALLALAVGAWDWRAGVALLGIALILTTVTLPTRPPRRTP